MDSVRVVVVLAFLALAGCASPVSEKPAVAPSDDGMQVFAIRVEPFTNSVDWHGRISPKACAPAVGAPCRNDLAGMDAVPVGFDASPQDDSFQESRGLFWRVGLNATWHNEGPVQRPLTMSWATIRSDGSVSREIGNKTADSFIEFPLRDVFLIPGETGIRIRVDLGGQYPYAIGNGVEYHVQGVVQAFLPASAPVLLS